MPKYLTDGIDQEGLEERFINAFIGKWTVVIDLQCHNLYDTDFAS